jgi:hypothetical protein
MDRRVVCAALRSKDGAVICGARHFDAVMVATIVASDPLDARKWKQAEQGFIDQHGEFLTREEAHKVATEAGQIVRRCGGDEERLFSENLY